MANIDDEMGGGAIYPNNEEDEHNEEEEEITPEEYDKLDAKLDDLNIALDLIEQKNDKIRDEFLKLLHSNQQIREELRQENQTPSDPNTDKEPPEET